MRWAYYNEHDAFAAQWLRQIIAAGHVAAGEVDERSIVDVRADDLRGFAQVHLFAGIGGWSLALRQAGWPDERPVWTGSCPCQPFSSAGKRRGAADARHLWPEMLRLVRECAPERVFGEQVASAVGHGWLDGISTDLEAAGYAVGAAVLGAHSVGAPHRRQRLWWVAHAHGVGRRKGAELHPLDEARDATPRDGSALGGLELADGAGRIARQPAASIVGHRRAAQPASGPRELADAGCGRGERRRAAGQVAGTPRPGEGEGNERQRLRHAAGDRCADGRLADAAGLPGPEHEREPRDGARRDAPADHAAERGGFDPWDGTVLIPCADGKARRVKPGICPLAAGIPGRVGLLRGAGNSIVPQVAAAFIAAAEEALAA